MAVAVHMWFCINKKARVRRKHGHYSI